MAENRKRKQLRTFPGLAAEDFQHPDDAAATEALRALPGFDTVMSKIMEYKVLLTLWRSHSLPILRAKELDAWHSSGYRELAGPRGLLEA